MAELYGVFSNFNHVPKPEILDRVSDYVILDQSNDANTWNVLESKFNHRAVRSLHCGHNLIDYLSFIVENFESLPEFTLLGKGNMVPRHISLEDFRLKTQSVTEDLTPLFSASYVEQKPKVASVTESGWYKERNNSWYAHLKRHRYFVSLNDLGNFLYSNWENCEFVTFSPGACYVVSRQRLRAIPLANFTCLRTILQYDFFPSEAWMIERILGPLLRMELRLKDEWHDPQAFRDALDHLPDLTELKVSGAGPFSRVKNFCYRAEFKLRRYLLESSSF